MSEDLRPDEGLGEEQEEAFEAVDVDNDDDSVDAMHTVHTMEMNEFPATGGGAAPDVHRGGNKGFLAKYGFWGLIVLFTCVVMLVILKIGKIGPFASGERRAPQSLSQQTQRPPEKAFVQNRQPTSRPAMSTTDKPPVQTAMPNERPRDPRQSPDKLQPDNGQGFGAALESEPQQRSPQRFAGQQSTPDYGPEFAALREDLDIAFKALSKRIAELNSLVSQQGARSVQQGTGDPVAIKRMFEESVALERRNQELADEIERWEEKLKDEKARSRWLSEQYNKRGVEIDDLKQRLAAAGLGGQTAVNPTEASSTHARQDRQDILKGWWLMGMSSKMDAQGRHFVEALVSVGDQTMQIREGQTIEGVTVREIDTQRGVVRTSAGDIGMRGVPHG